jgi:hypothetical protein
VRFTSPFAAAASTLSGASQDDESTGCAVRLSARADSRANAPVSPGRGIGPAWGCRPRQRPPRQVAARSRGSTGPREHAHSCS